MGDSRGTGEEPGIIGGKKGTEGGRREWERVFPKGQKTGRKLKKFRNAA